MVGGDASRGPCGPTGAVLYFCSCSNRLVNEGNVLLTAIEVAGSALVAILYIGILATVVTMKSGRKPASQARPPRRGSGVRVPGGGQDALPTR
jgi:hypothetical protein